MSATATILVVEDEPAIRELLRFSLVDAGYDVREAADAEAAKRAIARSLPDLVLLDWMLPSLSGIEVCRQIRRRPETRSLPIIMLTARAEDQDMVRGLNTGADDYITKPFSTEALLARIRSLLRRTTPAGDQAPLQFDDIVMDPTSRRVRRGGRPVHLGPTEYRLLEFFLLHPRRVFSRAQLLDVVWGHDIHVELRTVDVHIRRLRKALNEGDRPDIVRTVRSAGYALDADQV